MAEADTATALATIGANLANLTSVVHETRTEVKAIRAEEAGRGREMHARIDRLAESLSAAAIQRTQIEAKLGSHIDEDNSRFTGVAKEIDESKADRKGLWKAVVGGVGGGAVMSGIVEAWTKVKGG